MLHHHLESIGVGGEVIRWVERETVRRYWALHWATWYPLCAKRVGLPSRFIEQRVRGAIAGKEDDRRPPREWSEREDRQRGEERREAARSTAVASERANEKPRAAVCFGQHAEPLWNSLVSAQPDHTRELLRAGVVAVEMAVAAGEENGAALLVTMSSRTEADLYQRRRATLMVVVREIVPSFPDVWFRWAEGAA